MSFDTKWHYDYVETISCDGIQKGKYYAYHEDIFDYILNNDDWVYANHAIDEQNWILDQLDKMLESNDGEMIYIPTFNTAEKIDLHYRILDFEIQKLIEVN